MIKRITTESESPLSAIKIIKNKINVLIDWLNGNSCDGSFRVYTALISQSGTDTPTLKVLNNTLGIITPIYSAAGTYSLNCSGLFITDKTFYHIEYDIDPNFTKPSIITYQDSSTMYIYTYDNAGTPTDSILNNTPLEIRVYN